MHIEYLDVEWASRETGRFWWINEQDRGSLYTFKTVEKPAGDLSKERFLVAGRVIVGDFEGYRRVDLKFETVPVDNVLSVEMLLDDGCQQEVKQLRIPCAFYRKPFAFMLNVITVPEEEYPDYDNYGEDYHEVVTLSGLYDAGEKADVWLHAWLLLKICMFMVASEEVSMEQKEQK